MSDQSTAPETTSRSVAILGADALLVALPCTPTQLANACFAGGYAEVFPATWGDELIASGCLEQLESRTGPAIFCACPLVAEQLRGAAELKRFIVPLISPPVAVARYLRALYADDDLQITYVGDCPGADDESIDERLSPHELLATLAKRGILPATQRPDLGTHAAHDRRRFYSIPGGVPSPQWLSAQWPRRTLVDVHAGDALANLASQTNSRGNTLIDFAPHLGCACAGAVGGADTQDARKAVIALEPPRSQTEVVSAAVRVEVSLAPAGEHQPADVTWGDFLAALPAALAMPADGHSVLPAPSRRNSGSRRARERKAALPRAYLATRQGSRRERTGPGRAPAAADATVSPSVMVARAAAATARASQAAEREVSAAPREEVSSARPSPWVGRRASFEGMTGPRGSTHRARLAPADRWLLAGLMIAGSVLVAVLTSAFTVRGMQRTDPTPVTARQDSVVTPTVATVIATPVVDSTPAPRADNAAPDSASLASSTRARDSAPEHEDGGTVAPPAAATHLSPMPVHSTPVHEIHREPAHVERHPAPAVQHSHSAPVRTASQPSPVTTTAQTTREPASTQPAVTAPATTVATPVVVPPPAPPAATPAPTAATPAANAPAANTPASNQQVLDELRAIHAEIDARKKHVDSLAKALDSLKHT